MRDAAKVLPAEPARTIKLRLALRGKTFLKPAIIFDLDGTLVDSLDDLQTAVNATLQSLARPALERAAVAPMVGDGARALLQRALNATGGVPQNFSELLAGFLELYEANASRLTRPYPDVPDVLSLLQADGWTLAICTNKPHAVTTRLLADLGIDHHFAAVLGGDSLPVGKPDPEPVLAVLRAVGGDGRRSVIVGDHANDLAAGQADARPSRATTAASSADTDLATRRRLHGPLRRQPGRGLPPEPPRRRDLPLPGRPALLRRQLAAVL
jgi:phosphoglycolate phosphatase